MAMSILTGSWLLTEMIIIAGKNKEVNAFGKS